MANESKGMTSSELDRKLSLPRQDDETRVLRRLRLPDRINDRAGQVIKRGLVIDVETTGLSIELDDVTQLAMLPFDYEPDTGNITTIYNVEAFEGLREPSVPISEEAGLITGITADMVAGQVIDAGLVDKMVGASDLVIAHNANFDRPMVEKIWPVFSARPWVCTLDGVDWLREGFTAGKLDYLGMQFGWFYDGHRALADCEACLALLAQTLPTSGKRVLEVVRESGRKSDYLVRAVNSPFDQKDSLKDRGYKWRPEGLANGKVWWTTTDDPEAEVQWLEENIYHRKVSIPVTPITSMERYSNRIWTSNQ